MEKGQRPKPIREPSLESGLTWLLSQQTRGGWWLDFGEGFPPSDEYTTAFVLHQLLPLTGRPEVAIAIERGREALLAREAVRRRFGKGAGWGWSMGYPSDADTTAIALLALGSSGELDGQELLAEERRQTLHDFLYRHRQPGGVGVYSSETRAAINAVTGCGDEPDGFLSVTACSTASGAIALQSVDPGLAAALIALQGDKGTWIDYYWRDEALTTALACQALFAVCATPSLAESAKSAIKRAGSWAASQGSGHLASHGVSLTIWLIRILQYAALADPADCAVRSVLETRMASLVAEQLPDGSWPPSARLAVPFPWAGFPDYAEPFEARETLFATCVDDGRAFSTAAAVAALDVLV